jgi:cell division septation protein DedD
MLFDRFSFRERESGMSEEEPVVADLPTESRSYSFTLDTRQVMFLIAGYCFLCVLVFALGVVVGRATTSSETVAETQSVASTLPREQPATGRPERAAGNRIPLVPAAETKTQAVQGPEFAFTPTLPESPSTAKSESAPIDAPPRSKPAPTPEVMRSSEPATVAPKAAEKRDSEPGRLAPTVDSYAAYVQSVDLSDKGTWHRVRVGNYRDKEGAERVASDLRSQESLPATVMKK